MTTRRCACLLGSVACLTIGLYLALVVLATGCASMPLSSSETHHHSQESAHAPLCAWSCQMVSQSGLVASAPMAVVTLVAISLVALSSIHTMRLRPLHVPRGLRLYSRSDHSGGTRSSIV